MTDTGRDAFVQLCEERLGVSIEDLEARGLGVVAHKGGWTLANLELKRQLDERERERAEARTAYHAAEVSRYAHWRDIANAARASRVRDEKQWRCRQEKRVQMMTRVMLCLDGFTQSAVAGFLNVDRAAVTATLHKSKAPIAVGAMLMSLRDSCK